MNVSLEQVQMRRKQFQAQLVDAQAQLAKVQAHAQSLMGAITALDEILSGSEGYGAKDSQPESEPEPEADVRV